MSRDVPKDGGILYGKAAVFGDTIKGTCCN